MSTLKTVNIQHPSSASVNAGTDTSGNFLMNSGYGSAATAYACRAWVNFDGTGTYSPNPSTSKIRASGNVSSILKNGAGDYTVNFTNAMPDVNYSAVCSAANGGAGVSIVGSYQTSTSSVTMVTRTGANAASDMSNVSVAVFR